MDAYNDIVEVQFSMDSGGTGIVFKESNSSSYKDTTASNGFTASFQVGKSQHLGANIIAYAVGRDSRQRESLQVFQSVRVVDTIAPAIESITGGSGEPGDSIAVQVKGSDASENFSVVFLLYGQEVFTDSQQPYEYLFLIPEDAIPGMDVDLKINGIDSSSNKTEEFPVPITVFDPNLGEPPTAPEVSIEPSEPDTLDNLEAKITIPSTDPDGDPVTYRHEWFVDGVEQLDLTDTTVSHELTQKGETWEVVVTPNDGYADGTPGTASVTIVNTPPEAPQVSISPEFPVEGKDDIVCTANATDVDGDTVSYQYTWSVDGEPTDYDSDTIPAEITEKQQTWTCSATLYDGEEEGEAASAEVTIYGSNWVDLSQADVKLVGEDSGDFAGSSVANVGDVNGDGYADILIGAGQESSNGTAAGAAYLVVGPVLSSSDLSLAAAKFVGEQSYDYAGSSVSGAGDVNGDGYDDLLIGAPGVDGVETDSGAAYLFFGPVQGTVSLSQANARFEGERAYDQTGSSVSAAGDVNNDGFSDILIGAPCEGDPTELCRGRVYLFFGPLEGQIALSEADAVLIGERAGDQAGYSVAGAGDVNDDGFADLLIGAPLHRPEGTVYLVLGPVTGIMNLSGADAIFVNEETEGIGRSVSDLGDVNGDGYDDIFIGSPFQNADEENKGSAFVVFGPVEGEVDLSESADVTFIGERQGDGTAISISAAGDFNGDGNTDFLIGDWQEPTGGDYAGGAYLVYGPVSGAVDLEQADIKFIGEDEYNFAGLSVSSAGDLNGDGLDDIVIGATGADDSRGAVYVIYGKLTVPEGEIEGFTIVDAFFTEDLGINSPTGIAFSSDTGSLFITDPDHKVITEITSSGDVWMYDLTPWDIRPDAIAYHPTRETLFISDTIEDYIYEISLDGMEIQSYFDARDLYLSDVFGIEVDPDMGDLWLMDLWEQFLGKVVIMEVAPDGKAEVEVTEEIFFDELNPFDVTFGPEGNFYVTGQEEWDGPQWTGLWEISSEGDEIGEFDWSDKEIIPYGITTDPETDLVYISGQYRNHGIILILERNSEE
jgi:hypothetical protein